MSVPSARRPGAARRDARWVDAWLMVRLLQRPRDDRRTLGVARADGIILVTTRATARPAPRAAATGERDENGDGDMTKTILIADDEEFIVDLLATLLEDEGYLVLRAYDGEQALTAARHDGPNLIITDIMMPKMSGTELAKHLRAQEDGDAQTPIILMSAVSNAATIPNTVYLPKPFDIDHVLHLVNRLIH